LIYNRHYSISLHFTGGSQNESYRYQRFVYFVFSLLPFLLKFILSYVFSFVEGRRYEQEDFWPAAKQKILTRQEEEVLASQQETQMIYFIQQVGRPTPPPPQLPLTLPPAPHPTPPQSPPPMRTQLKCLPY